MISRFVEVSVKKFLSSPLQDVGKETSLNLKLNLSIVNALWLLLSGERFSLEDPKLKAIVSKFDAALRLESNSSLHQLLGAISPNLTKIFNHGYKGGPSCKSKVWNLQRILLMTVFILQKCDVLSSHHNTQNFESENQSLYSR